MYCRRFIPTHVGNTSRCTILNLPNPVHPHACGEHDGLPLKNVVSPGSSPRMWGTRDIQKTQRKRLRFIPTHVGNTLRVFQEVHQLTVHPHACGEHAFSASECYIFYGSSPRMWGTRIISSSIVSVLRFIPTHVGNTS